MSGVEAQEGAYWAGADPIELPAPEQALAVGCSVWGKLSGAVKSLEGAHPTMRKVEERFEWERGAEPC